MDRRALAIVLLFVLAVLAFLGYRAFNARHTVATVAQRDAAAQQNAASQPQLQRASATAQQPDGGQTTQPATQPAGQPVDLPANGDTISPNPPNGVLFTGSGRYQLYRQGNITWRLDTDTGHTCVIFATDEEWVKPRVYHSGCAKN